MTDKIKMPKRFAYMTEEEMEYSGRSAIGVALFFMGASGLSAIGCMVVACIDSKHSTGWIVGAGISLVVFCLSIGACAALQTQDSMTPDPTPSEPPEDSSYLFITPC